MEARHATASPPVLFRQVAYCGAKPYRHGTHRACPPEETRETVTRLLPAAGVTRVADVTGLDVVGFPTTLALRPNSATMACSSGKGLTPAAAFVSGAMEAIELYAAETVKIPSVLASYEEMADRGPIIARNRLPLSRSSLFNVRWPFHWSYGWDLCAQTEVAVPLASLQMARTAHMARHMGAFQVSSNGLGAGNTFLEAVLAALYEVIERDGITCNRLVWESGVRYPSLIPCEAIHRSPLVSGLIEQCDAADVEVRIYDCTVETDVPTYMAYVFNRLPIGLGIFRGYGAHLDTEVAMLRAISEALQGRLNYIAGSRDDIFRAGYWRLQRSDTHDMIRSLREETTTTAPHREPATTPSFEGDVHSLLSRLNRVGFDRVIVVDMTPPDFPISVVRVMVPGLEGYMHYGYTPGERGLKFAAGMSK
jgi:ribosomal protein S12 methylthiotransferase accessory factor